MEAAGSSESSVSVHKITECHNPEGHNINCIYYFSMFQNRRSNRLSASATATLVPVIHHTFNASEEEIMAQYLHTLAYLGFHLIIMIEVFSLLSTFQWSTEMEVTRAKV
jgi:hypothetical protein